MRSGFTLVEISIVLVIIGLLTGGILIGQGMIAGSKLQKTVRQFSEYESAVRSFHATYNQWPGDTNLFGSESNNNGLIAKDSVDDPATMAAEINKIWQDLSDGIGLKNYKGEFYLPTSLHTSPYNTNSTEENCPRLAISRQDINNPCLHFFTNPQDVSGFVFHYHSSAGIVFGATTPADTRMLDAKLDDGRAQTGILKSHSGPDDLDPQCLNGSWDYNLNNSEYECEFTLVSSVKQ